MNAKDIKPMKKEEKKGINIFFLLVEFVFCSFIVACFSMKMPVLGVLSALLAVFITPFPDYLLKKLGRKPINRNLKFGIGVIGFILLCYLVPNSRISEVKQRQIQNMQLQNENTSNQNETTLNE